MDESKPLKTDSGIEVKKIYSISDIPTNIANNLGFPGEYPYTRGIYSEM